jgi:hypothetical protein
MKTKEAFNVRTQQMEMAVVTVDNNGEFVFTFDDGSFFKLPATVESKEEVDELLAKHEEQNTGQVTVEAQEKKLAEILGDEAPIEEIVEE